MSDLLEEIRAYFEAGRAWLDARTPTITKDDALAVLCALEEEAARLLPKLMEELDRQLEEDEESEAADRASDAYYDVAKPISYLADIAAASVVTPWELEVSFSTGVGFSNEIAHVCFERPSLESMNRLLQKLNLPFVVEERGGICGLVRRERG